MNIKECYDRGACLNEDAIKSLEETVASQSEIISKFHELCADFVHNPKNVPIEQVPEGYRFKYVFERIEKDDLCWNRKDVWMPPGRWGVRMQHNATYITPVTK